MNSAERYRQNADDCRQRSLQARTAADKANWLKIAEEWQKLAEEVDVANGTNHAPKADETLGLPSTAGGTPLGKKPA
jgi:hypothetical protein